MNEEKKKCNVLNLSFHCFVLYFCSPGAPVSDSRYAPYGAPPSSSAKAAPIHDVNEIVIPEGADGLNLYVCDLPLQWAKEDFENLYRQFGQLASTTVLYDQSTGLSRGLGFAKFVNQEEAKEAMKATHGLWVEGNHQSCI
jgi:hypothetical protein